MFMLQNPPMTFSRIQKRNQIISKDLENLFGTIKYAFMNEKTHLESMVILYAEKEKYESLGGHHSRGRNRRQHPAKVRVKAKLPS